MGGRGRSLEKHSLVWSVEHILKIEPRVARSLLQVPRSELVLALMKALQLWRDTLNVMCKLCTQW